MLPIPTQSTYRLTNARIPAALLADPESELIRQPIAHLSASRLEEDLVAVEIEIRDGQIAALYGQGDRSDSDLPSIDLKQGMVWPCFVDLHTHLDKGHAWMRSPNPNGTFDDALDAAKGDKKHWDIEDLYRRMEFGLRCSYAHGTQAIRTHLDAGGDFFNSSLQAFLKLREEWRDRISLQAVPLLPLDYYLTPEGEALADQMAAHGGLLGGVSFGNPDLDEPLDRVFALAQERGLDLDFHTDESLNPDHQSLRAIAKTAIRRQFAGRIVCGHCCSLSVQSPEDADTTIRLVKEANIGIVSLPMCNLYLQDRHPGRMPRLRGVTLLHELKQQQVPVAVASDNCRDPFHAYGDHDGLEVFAQSVKIAHLDRPHRDWCRTVTRTPAELMGLPQVGQIGTGLEANLILFKARNFGELLSRPQSDRTVIRNGKAIDTTLPDYSELDDLMGDRV
ncbi:MAG: cytosine deaminase [Synechococcales cyanobacterium T60_A2020_003]|nr:cytosine deaminase [Synechococcales cyanobacterium T60_A2020_003]